MSQTDTTSDAHAQNPAGSSVADRSREAAERLQYQYQELGDAYDQTRARLENFNDQAVAFVRENPAACIVGAAAVGFLIGRLAARRWFV